MKTLALCLAMMLAVTSVSAQVFTSRTGRVSFFSGTPLQNIEAVNNEAACALNMNTGDLSFVVPIKSFKFEKALMQEHFNENYMESDKFPKAEFKGRITNLSVVNMSKAGKYTIQVKGKMTIHGITREVTIPAVIVTSRTDMDMLADATFNLKCADYGIKIPSVVESKIASEIRVMVTAPMGVAGR